jgi:chorismate mutase
MATQLNELRDQVAVIDREIVAALAQRSRLRCPARPHPVDPAFPAGVFSDTALVARIRADYANRIAKTIDARRASADDTASCAAADHTLVDAVRRRLRVALQIAGAKAAGQTPRFQALILARNAGELEKAITQPAVEEQVVARAVTSARELPAEGLPANFADRVASIYRDWIIPLARRVQVESLLAGK